MMRFSINLSTRPAFDRRSVNLFCSVVLIVLLSLLVLNGRNLMTTDAALTRMKQQLEHSEKSPSLPVPGDKELQGLKSRIDFANKLIRQKSRNQLVLLNHLEQVTPDGIVLTSLQPAEKDGLLKLEGSARNFSLIQTYLKKLHASDVFKEPLLLSQTPNNSLNQGIGFSISCKVKEL